MIENLKRHRKFLKLTGVIILVLALTITFTACDMGTGNITDNDGENPVDDGEDYVDVEGVAFKGSFSQDQASGQVAALDDSTTGINYAILIYSDGYEKIEIEGEDFVIDMKREPGAVAFVDENNEFAGYLTLREDLKSIPVQAVDLDQEIVDLGEVEFEGDKVVPEEDVINTELNISENELSSIAVAESFFSAVATNPELVEHLAKKDQQIGFGIMYFTENNTFDENGKIDANNIKLDIRTHRLGVGFDPPLGDSFSDLTIEYPGDVTRTVTQSLIDKGEADQSGVSFPAVGGTGDGFEDDVDNSPIPTSGSYRLYDNDKLDINFELPQVADEAEKHLVMPLPEFHIDENGMVEGISWEFITGSGEPIENPENLLNYIELQISGHQGRIFDSGNIRELESEHYYDLSDQEFYWEYIDNISMAYNDLYDIHYVVGFDNPIEVNEINIEDTQSNEEIENEIAQAKPNDFIKFNPGDYGQIDINNSDINIIALDDEVNVEGFYIENQNNITIDGFTIDGSVDVTNNDDGIKVLDNSSNIRIRNSNIINHDGYGLSAVNSKIFVENNTIANNKLSGINLSDESTGELTNNTIQNNTNDGIFIQNSSPVIMDNTLKENGFSGISLTGPKDQEGNYTDEIDNYVDQMDIFENQLINNATNEDADNIQFFYSGTREDFLKDIIERNSFDPESGICDDLHIRPECYE